MIIFHRFSSIYAYFFRGLWGAFDEWTDDLVPVHDSSGMANPQNYLVTALIAMVVLIALGCFNTPSSRGVRNLQVTYQYHLILSHSKNTLQICIENQALSITYILGASL